MPLSLPRPRLLASAAVLLLLAGAAWLRLVGVRWGLPFLYDLDESYFVLPAYKMLASRDLNPHWFGHPGSTTIYTNAIAFGLEGARAVLSGEFQRLSDIGREFWEEPSRFYLIARVVAVLFGVATVALTYRLARKRVGPPAALAAAALLAVAPLHVEYSQIARTDAQQVFLFTLVALCCLRMARQASMRNCVFAGVSLGLAIACKYPSVIAAAGIVVAFLVARQGQGRVTWQNTGKPIAVTTAACVAGAFVGSPYMFLDFGQVLRDLATEGRASHLSAASPGFVASLALYVRTLTVDDFGLAAIASALAGAVVWWRRWREMAPLLALLIAYLVCISLLKLHWSRWALPVMPLVCLLMASSLELHRTLPLHAVLARRAVQAAAALLLAVCAWQALLGSLSSGRERQAQDNRTVANEWIDAHVPAGTRLAIERYTPQPDKRRFSVYFADRTGELKQDEGPSRYAATSGALSNLANLDDLAKAGVRYVVLGNTVDRMQEEPQLHRDELEFYRRLTDSATLVHESMPVPGRNRGNHVRIYQLN
ncbi:MAG: phospholipid carrier-dependent glycosyltransferase [Rubrivivax sp.]|nr:MAG: phospholipid carrier-dependent glycosyltransferase [Rubrivivax sp.]